MPDESSENDEQNLSDDANSQSEDDGPLEDDQGDSALGKRGRKENGLVTLTLRFIELLKKAPNQTLDLN